MGSIDESALQNLNLVVNLTKHIHIKAKGNPDEVGSEEYSEYFPSFMWVVRDFTLQLINDEDEHISPNQYLEKALEEQKGFTDKIEEKNRIRRLLKTFFIERQCFTMIRPVTDEDSLQTLEQMDESNFRPDFLEQVTQLRKKVTHWVKAKTMNGNQLTPEMFLTLAESYVYAINKGAVPNIENSWTYICQNESKKSLDKAIDAFDESVNTHIIYELPFEEEMLRQFYKEKKKECRDIFIKNCIGGIIEEDLQSLKYQLENKFESILKHNETECIKCWNEFLDSEYSEMVDNRLKEGKINDLNEYDNAVREFRQFYIERAPPGPNRLEWLVNFLNERLIEASDHFNKKLTIEAEHERKITEEKIRSLENQIDELKRLRNKDREENDQKIKELSLEKAQLIAKLSNLEEIWKTDKEDYAKNEAELREKYRSIKSDLERQNEIMKNKEMNSRKIAQEMESKLCSEQNEFAKEKALLSQKIEFLETNLNEMKEKQSQIRKEVDEEKQHYMASLREKQNELESTIDQLTAENEAQREEIVEHKEKISKIQQSYDERIQELEDKLTEANSQSSIYSSEEFERIREESQEEIKNMSNQFREIQEDLSKKILEAEELLKKNQQEIAYERNQFDKDKAILEQQVELLTAQIGSMNQELWEKKEEIETLHKSVVQSQNEGELLTKLQNEFQSFRYRKTNFLGKRQSKMRKFSRMT